MRDPTKDTFFEEEAHYLPELPPGSYPADEPYVLDRVPPEFTAKPFTLDD